MCKSRKETADEDLQQDCLRPVSHWLWSNWMHVCGMYNSCWGPNKQQTMSMRKFISHQSDACRKVRRSSSKTSYSWQAKLVFLLWAEHKTPENKTVHMVLTLKWLELCLDTRTLNCHRVGTMSSICIACPPFKPMQTYIACNITCEHLACLEWSALTAGFWSRDSFLWQSWEQTSHE